MLFACGFCFVFFWLVFFFFGRVCLFGFYWCVEGFVLDFFFFIFFLALGATA